MLSYPTSQKLDFRNPVELRWDNLRLPGLDSCYQLVSGN